MGTGEKDSDHPDVSEIMTELRAKIKRGELSRNRAVFNDRDADALEFDDGASLGPPPEDAAIVEWLNHAAKAAGRKAVVPMPPLPDLSSMKRRCKEKVIAPIRRHVRWQINHISGRQNDFNHLLVQFMNGVGNLAGYIEQLDDSLSRTRDELKQVTTEFRADLGSLQGQISRLKPVQNIQPAPTDGKAAPMEAAPATGVMDESAYLLFENRFRGSEKDIFERQRVYLPLFEGKGPIADCGCGRGEFLSLLREAGIDGVGVDSNPEMVAWSKAKGLKVVEDDLIHYLSATKNASFGGIFAAQVIEHLTRPDLGRFLDLAYEKLKPGGVIALETVNPTSLAGLVGFYIDPSHGIPIHPEALRFILETKGFQDIEIRFLSPVEQLETLDIPASTEPEFRESLKSLNRTIERLNGLLLKPQDFAAAARRAKGG